MKASIWLGKDKFEIKDVPIPEIMDDQVLVKVKKVGLCGTDVHITQGLFPSTPPKILGHEFSGEIVDVGRNVDKDNIGKPKPFQLPKLSKKRFSLSYRI